MKKVFALVLAFTLALAVLPAACVASAQTAADLTDWNTIYHQTAVSQMVDLGIINGMPDGSFSPAGNIDRASWAKMVYVAATGSNYADDYLGAGIGLNDIAGTWAEGYISFLKMNGYISGDSYGNYNPNNNVTVVEACKMMLTILGYGAEDRGYQNNAAWADNIMADAQNNGLMDNVDGNMTALVPLTRENAAEIVWNALNAHMVEGIPVWDSGERHIDTYNKLNTLGYHVFGLEGGKPTAPEEGQTGLSGYAGVIRSAMEEWEMANAVTIGATEDIYGRGALYDVDGDGAEELFLLYWEVADEGGIDLRASLYTLLNGRPTAVLSEALFSMSGAPEASAGAVRKDGQTYFGVYRSGEGGASHTLYTLSGGQAREAQTASGKISCEELSVLALDGQAGMSWTQLLSAVESGK